MQSVKKKIWFFQKKWCRAVLVALLAVLLAAAVEFAWNYQSLRWGDLQRDVTASLESTQDGDAWKYECVYDFGDGVYLDKLLIRGSFAVDMPYTVELVTKNEFGEDGQKTVEDKAFAVYEEAFTNIGQTVRSLTFRVDSEENLKGKEDMEDFQIDQILVYRQFCFNKYRFLFFAVIFFLAGLVLVFRKLLTDHLEWLFAAFAAGFGMLMLLLSGPGSQTWDEQIHYRNVYQLASGGSSVDWNAAAWYNYKNELPEFNTKEELFMLRQYQNENARIAFHSSDNFSDFGQMAIRAYLPMVLFYRAGKLLGLPYSTVYMLGRMGNLVCYLVILWLAIRIAKEKKILIFALAVLPTVVFQESMYTYDGVVFSLMVLGFVLLLNEFSDTGRIHAFRFVAAVALIVAGCLSKAVYVPMLLFALALPNAKFQNRRQAYLCKVCVCVIFLLMMSTFVLPVLTSSAETNLAYSDARGGDTGVLAQLISMIRHPVATVKLFVSSIFSFDNFRNLGVESADRYLMTNLMCLNFAALGTLADKWSLLLLPMLCLLFFIPSRRVYEYSAAQRVWMGLLLFGTAVLIWLAMYLSFTAVGSAKIEGVQARYYLPLLVPLSCITGTGRLVSRMKEQTYNGIVVGISWILLSECIYQLMLVSRCL